MSLQRSDAYRASFTGCCCPRSGQPIQFMSWALQDWALPRSLPDASQVRGSEGGRRLPSGGGEGWMCVCARACTRSLTLFVTPDSPRVFC